MSEKLRALLRALTLTPRRLLLLSFAVFFTLSGSWAMASPMGSAPDDQAHMTKAAATARGEINGTFGYLSEDHTLQPARYFKVPATYAKIDRWTDRPCYAFNSSRPASCAPPIEGSTALVSLPTTAGHYNPIYYALVGWPSLPFPGLAGMYLMRLVSALLCSLLLAGAVYLAAQWRRPAFVLLGVSVAATPMALFINGVVNPNAAELSSALLGWTAALSITMDPRPDLFKRRLILLAVAAAVLANARPLGAEWIVSFLAVALFVKRRGALAGMLRDRFTWVVSAAAGVAILVGVGWSLTHGDNAKVPYSPSHALGPAAHTTLDTTPWYIHQMIGVFGWLDTPAPTVTVDIWIGAIMLLAVVGWACGRLRDGIALLSVLIGVIAIPIIAQGLQAKNVGLIWQGRYLLAFAVGLPILAGSILADHATQIPAALQRRIAAVALVLLAFANFSAFFHAMRRYAVGLGGALIPAHPQWEPPGTWLVWLLLYAVGLAAFVLLMITASAGRAGVISPGPAENDAAAVGDGIRSASPSRVGAS